MDQRPRAIDMTGRWAQRAPGVFTLASVALLVAAALAGLIDAGGDGGSSGRASYIFGLVRGSVLQAGLSTLVSLVLGAAIALALVRRQRFRGRSLLIAALNVATVLPPIVTVFAIIAVFGRSGWLSDVAGWLDIDYGSWVFGLEGVIIAHVLLNAPLAARVFLAAEASVSAEQWRLAAQLGMPPRAIFRFIDWPVLRREAPGIAALIFLACFTSFAIVLALGGGPGVSTLEVAIYEAVRFEADFRGAAMLAALQIAVAILLLAPVAVVLTRRVRETTPGGLAADRPDINSPATRLADRIVLAATALFIGAPLLTIIVSGTGAISSLFDSVVVEALATSVAIGTAAGLLAVGVGFAIALLAREVRARSGRARTANLIGLSALLILVVSPITLSAGLFVVLRPHINPFALAAPMIIVINALMALPFIYRHIEPSLLLAEERFGRLADSLGISGWSRFKLMDWPLLRAPLIVGLTMAIALSFGDLGVAAFFGTGDVVTLPLLLFSRLGAYRADEAASIALLLTLLVLAMFLIAQRWSGGWFARTR